MIGAGFERLRRLVEGTRTTSLAKLQATGPGSLIDLPSLTVFRDAEPSTEWGGAEIIESENGSVFAPLL